MNGKIEIKRKYRLVQIAVAVLVFMLAAILSASAQDDEATRLVNAAIRELNRSFPGIGQPDRFEFTFIVPTRDSTLGCPLVNGFDLGFEVVPYRIVLSFGDTQYIYHASADGSILLPCDPKLPIGGQTVPPGHQPFMPTPVEVAINTFLTAFPTAGFPDRFEFTFSLTTTDNALGCPLVPSSTLASPVIPYVITLHFGQVSYVYHVSQDGSIIIPCDARLLRPPARSG